MEICMCGGPFVQHEAVVPEAVVGSGYSFLRSGGETSPEVREQSGRATAQLGILNAMTEKVWFITGCSRGFGRLWAEGALDRGDKVVATARDVGSLGGLA